MSHQINVEMNALSYFYGVLQDKNTIEICRTQNETQEELVYK
jgi:hypothetical protein